jgi:very-short-patch-repair endonuclease
VRCDRGEQLVCPTVPLREGRNCEANFGEGLLEQKPQTHSQRRAHLKRGVARRLRNNATDAERMLWYRLRDKRLSGLKFRRQQPTGPYVVDFYCSEAKLIVELDGSQHGDGRHPAYDLRRTKWLQYRDYVVVRFWNSDVLNDSDYMLGAFCVKFKETGAEPNDPSPKFASVRFANFDPPSRGGLNGSSRN